MIQNILFYHVLCAVRIEMENHSAYTGHGLSMDRTSTGTCPIITIEVSNQSHPYS
jgi:ribosomal protein L31